MATSQIIIFDSKPNPERHPDRLRVVAALRGLTAAPFSNCSVLDIGCGVGADMIHFALSAPDSTFHGFDISEEHLAIGRGLIERLQLSNVTLESADIANFTSPNKYDYIFCHGVFSWVDQTLREKILKICSEHLSPSGIAFISFNCLPGWYTRDTLRKLLQQTDDPKRTPAERVEIALNTMQTTRERLAESQTLHSQQFQQELDSCLCQSNAFIYHELLASINTPFYLHDFMQLAAQQSLQYLGDGRPSRMHVLPGELEDREFRKALTLKQFPEPIEEQIWDTIVAPPIRGCLLCHDSHTLAREPEFSHIFSMHISSALVPLSDEPRVTDTSIEIFCDAREYNLEVQSPQLKAALSILAKKWPLAMPVQTVLTRVSELTGDSIDTTQDANKPLLARLGEYFFMNLVDLYFEPPRIAEKLVRKPILFPLAREQAALGFSWVSNPRFEYARIDELDRQILELLDGSHDSESIATILLKRIASGALEYRPAPDTDGKQPIEALIPEQVSRSIQLYFEAALFVD